MYTFKNRSHYAQQQGQSTTPTTWEQTVVNRSLEWSTNPDNLGLSYRVIGTRVNHQGLIVKPELAQIVLYEGTKKSVHGPLTELLQALANAWAASVVLPDGEAYRGHNAGVEGPETPQVSLCATGPYPYFS